MEKNTLNLSKTKLQILEYLRDQGGEIPLDFLLDSVQVENPSQTIYSEILELIQQKVIQIRRNELGIVVYLCRTKESENRIFDKPESEL